MARGPKHHMKRIAAPKHWMLDKLGGAYAPRASTGPHKLRECLPLMLLIRNRLKYALTRREVMYIVMQRLVQVDGKVRTDLHYPTGFMDVVSIPKTGENFRMLYDEKGRFQVHRISEEEAKFKLCRVNKTALGRGAIPYVVTHDSRTIRYPDPAVRVNDSVKVDIATGKIIGHLKFEVGNLAMIIGGRNVGRIGVIVRRERHPGAFDIVRMRDAKGQEFSTRLGNVFVIGEGHKAAVSVPKGKGVKLPIIEERAAHEKRLEAHEKRQHK